MAQQIILILHLTLAFAIIVLVLLQHGKGAEVGASFGSGASQTVFGSQGSASFLTKLTTVLAIGFVVSSIGLGYVVSYQTEPETLLKKIEAQQLAQEVPVLLTEVI